MLAITAQVVVPMLESFSATFFCGMVVLLLLGVGLLIWGWRGKRHGDRPTCRKCDYNLTGITSERCPECGAALTATTIAGGKRRRRWGPVSLGALLTVWAVWSGADRGLKTDWYPLWPTGWLIDDLQCGNDVLVDRIWQEIQRRDNSDGLTTSHQQQLIDACLAEHQRPTGSRAWLGACEFLRDCVTGGKLTGAQIKLLYENIPLPPLRVRQAVRAGDSVPFRIGDGFDMSTFFFGVRYESRPVRFRIDGQSVELPIRITEPGTYLLEVDAQFRLVQLDGGNRLPLPPAREQTLSTQVTVVEDDMLTVLRDPAFAREVRDHTRVDCDSVQLRIGILGVSMPLAFDVFLELDDHEVHVGRALFRPGQPFFNAEQSFRIPVRLGSRRAVTVILRTNLDIVRATLDVTSCWSGELRFDDVPIEASADARRRLFSHDEVQRAQDAARKQPVAP